MKKIMKPLLYSLFLVCSITSVAAVETVSVVGVLEEGDTLENGGPVDIYKITLKENQSCKVTIQSNEFDGVMQYMTPAEGLEGRTKIEEDAQPVSIEIRAKPGEGGVYSVRISKRRVEAPAKYIIQFTSTKQIVDAILRPDGRLIGDPDHPTRPNRPNPLGGGVSNLNPVEYEDSNGIVHPLQLGELAFVDESVSHDFGNKKPKGGSQNPDNAVGPIDYDPKKKEEGYFSLGDKGHGIWRFLDNSLVNGPGPDLLIFEIGQYEEPCTVEISEDGETWIVIGEAAGETSAIDIGDNAPADTEFFYVRLTDTKNKGGQWPGADVDAIAAINGRTSKQAAAAGNTKVEDWDKYIIPEILVGPVYPKDLSRKDQLGPDGSYTEFFRLDFLDVDPRTVSVASVRVSSTPDNRGGADGFEPRIHLYERSEKVPFIPSPNQNLPGAFPEPPVRYGVVHPQEATSTVVWSPASAPPGYKDYIVAITSRNNNNLGSYKLEFKLGHFPPSIKEQEEKKEPAKAVGN